MGPNKPSWLKVHEALHTGAQEVTLGSGTYPVTIASNGCRQVKLHDNDLGEITIMEQNKHKDSAYAQRARMGETLSWIIPKNRNISWILLKDKVRKEATVQNDGTFKPKEGVELYSVTGK